MVIMMGGCARVLVIMFILIAVFELIALIFCFSQRVDVAQGLAQSKKSSMRKKTCIAVQKVSPASPAASAKNEAPC